MAMPGLETLDDALLVLLQALDGLEEGEEVQSLSLGRFKTSPEAGYYWSLITRRERGNTKTAAAAWRRDEVVARGRRLALAAYNDFVGREG